METTKIGNICRFENGDRGENYPSKKDFVGRGIPFINSGNISNGKIDNADLNYITEEKYNKLRAGKAFKGDFVFTLRGSLGKNAIVEFDKCAIASMLVIMRPDETKIDKTFFRYAMNSPWLEKQVANVDNGSIQGNLGVSNVKDFFIPFPNIIEQKKIASILATLDNKISTNNKTIETSEKLMREIYNYWFVQFDFPDENGRPYKSSGGEMVYNETLKREIPKGWNASNILDVVNWVGGAQPPKSTFIYEPRNGYVRFIQNRDYADDNYKTWIPESKGNKICDRLDIMMDKYGDAGRIRFGLAGAYNVALAKIAIEKDNLREYIRGFLSSEAIYQYLYNACMASTRASLNEEILGNLNLAIPSKEILSKYQSIAEQNIQLILNLSDENKQLASLRDWLLPMLMNGQIKVSD